jgi:hypothetical protein
MLRIEALAKCVDGTCSDVTEDDAERSENEAAATGWSIPVVFNHLLGHAACRERLLVSFARDDPAKMIRHAPLLFSAERMLRPPSQRLIAQVNDSQRLSVMHRRCKRCSRPAFVGFLKAS